MLKERLGKRQNTNIYLEKKGANGKWIYKYTSPRDGKEIEGDESAISDLKTIADLDDMLYRIGYMKDGNLDTDYGIGKIYSKYAGDVLAGKQGANGAPSKVIEDDKKRQKRKLQKYAYANGAPSNLIYKREENAKYNYLNRDH